jgi:hypothetical protein
MTCSLEKRFVMIVVTNFSKKAKTATMIAKIEKICLFV